MKRKIKYKKVVTWEKKPKLWDILGGIAFCLGSIFVMALLFDKDDTTTLLAFVMTLLLVMGFKLLMGGFGEGRKKHYSKIK